MGSRKAALEAPNALRPGLQVRAVVDQTRCNGCELCVELCPEVFNMDGNSAEVIVYELPGETLDACELPAEECPAEAIRIEV